MTPMRAALCARAVGTAPRFPGATFLLVVAVSVAVALGCGAPKSSGFSATGNGDDGGVTFGGDSGPPPVQGLTGITISPANTMLTLQYPVTPPGATTQLKAEGTFQDGHTADVTASVSWATSPSDIAMVRSGSFSSLAPGTFAVTAIAGSVTSNSATVTVTLTGTLVGMGVTQGDLDGTPSGGTPIIAYPLDGALFPYQLGPIEFQVGPTSASQTEARIAFEGDNVDLKVYELCTPIATPTIPNACTITVPSELEQVLDGASEGATLTETVRLAAPGGGSLAESKPISARWSSAQLHGGLYYWSADIATGNTLIMRYNLDTPGMPPQQYFTEIGVNGMPSDEQNMDPPASNNSTMCFGCHAISSDGTRMGLAFGGSAPELFALIDVASKKSIATRLFSTDPNATVSDAGVPVMQPFAAFTALSPDGTAMVQERLGQLWLRSADSSLANLIPNALFTSQLGNELATTPFWAPQGDLLAFTGWVPNATPAADFPGDPLDNNGDQTPNSEIWIVSVMGDKTFGTPTRLVPQVSGKSEYYPAISDDSQFVVFDESSCSGPGAPAGEQYGFLPCDGYDDASATLRMVSSKGGQAVTLNNASQNDNWTNSWPRFAPTHGTFQGKTLYWIAFSSRHPYGATLPGTNNPPTLDTEPQLWFAAVAIDSSGMLSGDPSFAPVWLPQQNPGTQRGNHSPEWVTKAVSINQ
jgi:hypothetical protein